MTEPSVTQETPEEELVRLRSEIANLEAIHPQIVANIQANLEQAMQEIASQQIHLARIPELEQRAAQANTLQLSLNDMTQERDRLKQLLLGVVPSLQEFSMDYPAATIARTAFEGATPEEVGEKMALWDAARSQKASEWNSLVNYVRTQATV